MSRPEATYDHVVPRAQGGRTTWENIVIACVPCNQSKGGRTPSQAGMELLSVPMKPRKMANSVQLSFVYEEGMPLPWKKFLRDVAYWHTELEE